MNGKNGVLEVLKPQNGDYKMNGKICIVIKNNSITNYSPILRHSSDLGSFLTTYIRSGLFDEEDIDYVVNDLWNVGCSYTQYKEEYDENYPVKFNLIDVENH